MSGVEHMGVRNGKAAAWERLGWGVAAGFFGVGFWAAGKSWFLGRELEREWGRMMEIMELSDVKELVTRSVLLAQRQTAWWQLAVVCGWAALAAGAAAWAFGRKRRNAAGLGGFSFAGGPPAPPAAGEDDETTGRRDGGDGIRFRETRGD